MDKNADSTFKQILRLVNPLASTIYKPEEFDKLPFELKDQTDLMWANAGVAGLGFLGGAVLLKALSHKINARKWEKKNKKIVEDKVNALYPVLAPNYEKDSQTIEEVRNIGLNKDATNNGNSSFWEQAGDTIWTGIKGAIPVTVALSMATLGSSLAQERLEDKDKEDLDDEILKKRNELTALQAKLIDLQLHKKANNPIVAPTIGYGLGAVLAFLAPGVFMATKAYLDRNDRARKIIEAGENNAARNLTNIPQRLSLKLTPQGRPAITKEEQKYIAELKELADDAAEANIEREVAKLEAPSVDDFSDKLTEIKKDALFS